MARIALLAPDLGGNALYTPWMFAGALSSGHQTQLIGPEADRLWPPAEGEVRISGQLPGTNPRRREVLAAGLAAVRGSDLLYAFKAHPASFGLGLRLRDRLGIPLAVHLDDWDGGYFADLSLARRAWYAARTLRSPTNELYMRLLERRLSVADLLTVSSNALRERFGGGVIRQGVDAERFSPDNFPRAEARRRLGLDPEVPMVLFLGTPVPHKGLEELVEAVSSLPETRGARLWVVGDAPGEQEAGSFLAAEVVEHHPYVPFAEAAWYIAAADVFAVPQRLNTYAIHQVPGKLLHAMALGACIVGTDVGDIGDVLGGDPPAGLIVPPGDPAALREALDQLLGDPSNSGKLGAESRRRAVERYSWHAMARALDEEIAKLGRR